MSVREFAAHLGVSDRMVSKWEAGGQTIRPRPVNQAALDTSLARSSAEVRARFAATAEGPAVRVPGQRLVASAGSTARHLVGHPVDGKMMTLVDGGMFLSGHANERVWVPAFYVDVLPVTNAEYGQFVSVTGRRPPMHWQAGRCPDALLNHPVAMVSWMDATAYALWAAKALPTARQWEKAARGVAGASYPWGSYATPAMCNVRQSGVGTTTPVDWYDVGASPYGVLDMCGNVWEWCATLSHPGRYEIKGGAFTSSLDRTAPAAFNDAPADLVGDDVGFRCASSMTHMLELLSI
jgi:formylglycine-generating enzyme required for sulfatase activity